MNKATFCITPQHNTAKHLLSTTMSLPSFRPLLRARLRSTPANGHATFTPHIRKLVFEFCDKWPSSANTRTYIHNHIETLARTYPHVEIVVKQRTYKEPIIRGFYGRFDQLFYLILS